MLQEPLCNELHGESSRRLSLTSNDEMSATR